MNFTCLEELSDLDRTGLMVAMIGAAILLLVGLGLFFRLKLWQALTEIIYDKVHLKLPPPLLRMSPGEPLSNVNPESRCVQNKCGSGLAREEVVSVDINVE